jgi:hypothetical protein
VGSGYCCKKTPCWVAYATLGEVSAPCPALRFVEEKGHHVCGIYEDAEGEAKEKIGKSLHIGAGCCSNLNSDHLDVVRKFREELRETGHT